jgi:tight adherence protein C
MFVISTFLLALALIVGVYGIYVSLVRERDPVALRLRDLRTRALATRPAPDAERPSFLLQILATLGGYLPANDSKESLQSGLVRAGIRDASAPTVFLGVKLVMAIGGVVGWIAIHSVLGRPLESALFGALAAGAIGFYVPTIWLYLKGEARRGQVQRALPDTLDLLVVCVESGLGLNAAIERVGHEIALASPALSDEMLMVNQEVRTGLSRGEALRRLARRTGVEDVYALTALLVQADRLGTSVAQSLRAHAESMRTKRRQRAEQMARKAGIKLAFPLVFLIFPALLVVILGPAAIQLMEAIAAQNATR